MAGLKETNEPEQKIDVEEKDNIGKDERVLQNWPFWDDGGGWRMVVDKIEEEEDGREWNKNWHHCIPKIPHSSNYKTNNQNRFCKKNMDSRI